MSDYKVLAEVGWSPINLIWEGIRRDPDLVALIDSPKLIPLESPAEHQENTADTSLLSVYLYRIVEVVGMARGRFSILLIPASQGSARPADCPRKDHANSL